MTVRLNSALQAARVVFLRSSSGEDPVDRLWVYDVATGIERLIADPAAILGDQTAELPPAEREWS